jgi:hypothetical protein
MPLRARDLAIAHRLTVDNALSLEASIHGDLPLGRLDSLERTPARAAGLR